MKKIILTIAVAALFAACKKDRTCECTTTPGNDVNKTTIKNATKRQAKANCYSWSYIEPITSTKYETTCTLK